MSFKERNKRLHDFPLAVLDDGSRVCIFVPPSDCGNDELPLPVVMRQLLLGLIIWVRKGRRYFHIPVGILVMKIFSVQSKQICR
jgi:hypothetical protein